MSTVGSRLFIFGGQTKAKFLSDLKALDLNMLSKREEELQTSVGYISIGHSESAYKPQARTNSSMVPWNDELYL